MKGKKFSVSSLGDIICVLVLLIMTVLTFVNVCSRYVFHSSIAASEEITTNLFVVLSLVGAALALKDKAHVGLNIFTDMLPQKSKPVYYIYEGIAGMLFLGILTYFGILRVLQQFSTGMVSSGLAMPMWIYGSLCLLGFIILLASFAEIFIKGVVSLIKHDKSTEENSSEVNQ